MGSASSAPKAAAPAVDPLPAPPKRRGSLSKVAIPGAVTPKAAEGVMLSIVTNKTERKLFETYLANEFCEEIIRFWKATETFQRHRFCRGVWTGDSSVFLRAAIALGGSDYLAKIGKVCSGAARREEAQRKARRHRRSEPNAEGVL